MLSGCEHNQVIENDDKQYYIEKQNSYNAIANETEINTTDENDIIYTNRELGFEISIPAHWNDYYKITNTQGGICVNFYGKSLAGTGATISSQNGLPLFFILDETTVESETFDSRQKVGTAQNVNYYFVTGTGMDLEPILMIDDENIKNHKAIYGEELYGDNQIPIIQQDKSKALQMQNDILQVIRSFRAL